MNKPSKATITELRAAIGDLRWMREHTDDPSRVRTLLECEGRVERALGQLIEDKRLPCPHAHKGCRIVKPTARALSGHVRMCLYASRP